MSETGNPVSSQELVVITTGEIVNLADTQACVQALDSIRDFESRIRELKATLTRAVIEEATRQGVRSIELANGDRAEISPAIEIVYDAQMLTEGLREAGMPEERIIEIVREEVSYKVIANEAKKAAVANPDYAAAVNAARSEQPKSQYISIRRKR